MYQTYIQYFTFNFILNSLTILLYLTPKVDRVNRVLGVYCDIYRNDFMKIKVNNNSDNN